MSKVWICQNKTADIPFFIEEKKVNLYSLEELCYYLCQSAEVLSEHFFDEKLLNWMERELHLPKMCEQLRQGIGQKKNDFWCMETVLWESGYYTKAELEEIRKTANQLIQAKPEERRKLKADKLLSDGRYQSAVREYQLLLMQENPEKILESKIWHNMGTGYAGQFLFARAAECYEKAYALGGMKESREQYLLALACAEGQEIEEGAASPESGALQQIREKEGVARFEEELYQKLKQLAEEYIKSE